MSTTVHLVRQSPIARVQFRSDNGIQTFSERTRTQLADVLDELEEEDECQVAVFEADGRTFMAGVNIHEMQALTAEAAEQLAREGQELMTRVAALKPVTIAAIQAACAGGGCELALACDMRMAAASARIGLPEVSLGLLPGWGGTVRATRLFGGAVARRMILTGELLPAEVALQYGIVDSLSPDDEFRSAIDARVDMLMSRSPGALRAVKRLIREFEGPDLEAALDSEARAFGHRFATPEALEGIQAFVEKRTPQWDKVMGGDE